MATAPVTIPSGPELLSVDGLSASCVGYWAETDLRILLRGLSPQLHDRAYVSTVVGASDGKPMPNVWATYFAVVPEL